ncbi:archaeosortase/exosortase family protein [Microbacterium sp. A204]|uniref:archaeosortase/exosortase family protein n=1 Tax=Microbacterium sp. A204 TaxID=3457321 RepID=UPI003FD4F75F
MNYFDAIHLPTGTTMTTQAAMHTDLPVRRSDRAGSANGRRRTRAAQIFVSLALLAGAIALAVGSRTVQAVEARLVTLWLGPILPGGMVSDGPYYVIRAHTPTAQAFRITEECSAVVLLVPLFVVAAVIMLSTKVTVSRLLGGVLAMISVTLLVNQIRLGVIAWATHQWGMDPGYEISHRFVGSVIGIIGFSAGIAVLLLITSSRRRAGTSPKSAAMKGR